MEETKEKLPMEATTLQMARAISEKAKASYLYVCPSGLVLKLKKLAKFDLMDILAQNTNKDEGIQDMRNDLRNPVLSPEKVDTLRKLQKDIFMAIVEEPKVTEEPTDNSMGFNEFDPEDRETVFVDYMKKVKLDSDSLAKLTFFRRDKARKVNRDLSRKDRKTAIRNNRKRTK